MMEVDLGIETVYGSDDTSTGVMSEKVSALASSVYQEFERMIKKYDEDVVKELMPLVVNVLENLDIVTHDNQEQEVELELLRDDNEQLITQYEREKQLRKHAEQKALEMEDVHELQRRDLQNRTETLEMQTRQLELKCKNYSDQITRLEDRESEMKREYQALHQRHTEMIQTYMEHIERTKMAQSLGQDVAASPKAKLHSILNRPSSPNYYALSNQDVGSPASPKTPQAMSLIEGDDVLGRSPARDIVGLKNTTDLKDEEGGAENGAAQLHVEEKHDGTESRATDTAAADVSHDSVHDGTADVVTPDLANKDEKAAAGDRPTSTEASEFILLGGSPNTSEIRQTMTDKSLDIQAELCELPPLPLWSSEALRNGGSDRRVQDILNTTPELSQTQPIDVPGATSTPLKSNQDSLFQELTTQDSEALGEMDEGADITVSDSFFGMGKEVENLIAENTQLLETKNALNIVKDDLIAKVDELTSEAEMLQNEVSALQTSKQRLKLKVNDLEEELRKARAEVEEMKKGPHDEDDDVPMAQRKRFTRVEMARVLMERNQYKERLMELQEAVRWTEMIRASRENPELAAKKNKSSIWKFFSNLFSSSSSSSTASKKSYPPVNVRYNAPASQVQPAGNPDRVRSNTFSAMGDKSKAFNFLAEDSNLSEIERKRREKQEQYKRVRAHVRKDDGRMQAYGWSLPAKFKGPSMTESSRNCVVSVPVPVYCRPLLEKEPGMKIWCAAGVNLSGGKTRDGGSIVGASVFYSDSLPDEDGKKRGSQTSIDKLDAELKEREKLLPTTENMSSMVWICTSTHATSKVTVIDANNPQEILDTFSVCSSHLLCIASVPGAMEDDYPPEDFVIKGNVVVDTDSAETNKSDTSSESGIGGITVVGCATGAVPPSQNGKAAGTKDVESPVEIAKEATEIPTPAQEQAPSVLGEKMVQVKVEGVTPEQGEEEGVTPEQGEEKRDQGEQEEAEVEEEAGPGELDEFADPLGATAGGDGPEYTAVPLTQTAPAPRDSLIKDPNSLFKDGMAAIPEGTGLPEVAKMSSVLPTMWLGAQNGCLYVHSSVAQWRKCLHSIKLKDSVLSIVHVKGRVLVALADGTLAVFHRAADGQWDLTNYHLLDLGKPHHSIRCMVVVYDKVWCGYRNKIHVVQPKTLKIEKTFDAHPRKESQVRQLAWVGDGVWVSIRLDSTLRLYHAHTHQHLQDVDIEPYVSKMLGTGKLGFSFVRITALLISCNRLWVGTGNGVIISIPLTEISTAPPAIPASNKPSGPPAAASVSRPGGVIRVYSDANSDTVTPGSFIPYCSMAHAQLSFHGHRDAVKFFAAVPEIAVQISYTDLATKQGVAAALGAAMPTPQPEPSKTAGSSKNVLVISGGEGYIDFRVGDEDDDEPAPSGPGTGAFGDMSPMAKPSISKGERSHLIVWQIANAD
ncbi:PREDICTED: C-Jun-amino-terminal kinase-interacting protein 4-like isoform X2 [Branchiostoma belcheri]|uniref:C-Jun-amino-terminal kinase-interacting protein 4 n=1 Tax=Branchiostoma belcheri TaxID=7741 RepID=A0A6P5AMS2_BRABE|nr:PREDICTED: C-Jun-amino-terminal kinase-interacting protein 4-like isoform X2 [Branchiostoma belcheri]